MAIKIYIDQGHNPVNPNAGAEGNGLVAGSTFILLSSVAHVASVTNTTTSTGGMDAEEDNDDGNARYRARIRLAQQAVSACGTRAAYEYCAMQAVPSIVGARTCRCQPRARLRGRRRWHTAHLGRAQHSARRCLGGRRPTNWRRGRRA